MKRITVKQPIFVNNPNRKIRREVAVIDDLPDSIIRNIFKYLSIRDLFSSTLVCRRWHSLASEDELWMRIGMCHFSTKLKAFPLKGLKKHILTIGHKEMIKKIEVFTKSIRKKLTFPGEWTLKTLRLSLYLEMKNKKNEILFTWGKLLPENWTIHNLNFQVSLKKFELSPFNVEEVNSITLQLLVPHFPETFLSWKDSPRMKLTLCSLNTTGGLPISATKECKVHTMGHFHFCLENIIYALWNDTTDMAYLFISLLPHSIIRVLSNLLTENNAKTLEIKQSNEKGKGKVSSNQKSKIALTRKPIQLSDYRCFILLSDVQDNGVLLFSTWRSFDFSDGGYMAVKRGGDSSSMWPMVSLVQLEDRRTHIPFDALPQITVKNNHFTEAIKNAFLVKFVLEDNAHCTRLDFCKATLCGGEELKNVNYNYDGELFGFEIGNNLCNILGKFIHLKSENRVLMVQLTLAIAADVLQNL